MEICAHAPIVAIQMPRRDLRVFSPSLALLRVVRWGGRRYGGWEEVRTASCNALVYESFGSKCHVTLAVKIFQ